MSENKKNIRTGFSGFIRYLKGQMSGKEKNSFERELQRDLFTEEAFEGLSSFEFEEIETDIKYLQKQLKQRTKKRNVVPFYRIAASVAVLMVISTVVILLDRDRSDKQLATTNANPEIFEIVEQSAINSPVASLESVEITKKGGPDKSLSPSEKQQEKKAEKSEIRPEDSIIAAAEPVDITKETISIKGGGILKDDIQAAPAAAMESRKAVADMNAKEKLLKSESEFMNIADTSISDLAEIVSVGYAAKNSQKAKEDLENSGYEPPQPVVGSEAFNIYIKDNIVYPDSASAGQRVVVVLSLQINNTGKIDSIRVLRTPGKDFSNEAIRLIKSGPAWLPAFRNKIAVEDEVKIKILFR